MTHREWADKQKIATPCTAAHITFGGRCLNCGWADLAYMMGQGLNTQGTRKERKNGLVR